MWIFASYWLVKTCELSLSGIERKKVAAFPLTTLLENESKEINVDPGQLHYPTGINVEVGELYHFEAEGQWLDWIIPCGPKGWGSWFPLNYFNRQRGEAFFLLCGNVGKNDHISFHIGKGSEWTIPQEVNALPDRQLYLFANDWSCAYGNNKWLPTTRGGPLKVTITRLNTVKE